MAKFPVGGWFLDEYDNFSDWDRELRKLDAGTRTMNAVSSTLRDLSYNFGHYLQPLQFEEEGDAIDAEAEAAELESIIASLPRPSNPPHTQESSIRVKPRPTGAARVEASSAPPPEPSHVAVRVPVL